MSIEIQVDRERASKLQAARALATLSGPSVIIGETGPDGWINEYVSLYARREVPGGIQRPALNYAGLITDDPAEMRRRGEMILLAADVAELAAMLIAEQGNEAKPDLCDSALPLRNGGELKCTLDEGHYGAHSALAGKCRWHGHGADARDEKGNRIAAASATETEKAGA